MGEGRPRAITPRTLKKLRRAFLMGYSDREACLYAQIAPSTLYKYQEENPEFSEQKEQYKTNPTLKAKTTVFNNLDNISIAKWYLERKVKDEFSIRTESSLDHPQNTNNYRLSDYTRKQMDKRIEVEIALIRPRSPN
jgi:hypothetical protein